LVFSSKYGNVEVPKPLSSLGIGVDQISHEIRNSKVLTGNDLGRLGNVETLPSKEEIELFLKEDENALKLVNSGDLDKIHLQAHTYLENEDPASAWKILLAKSN